MTPRARLNLLLAAVVGGLALLAWLGGPPSTPETGGIADINPATIDHIHIQHEDGTGLAFTRVESGWRIDAGAQLDARAERLRALLNLPATPARDRLPASSVDLAALGLDPPGLILRLGDHEFAFGGTDPIADLRYVRHRDTVYLLEDRLYPLLRQGPAFFTDPRLLPAGFELQRLQLPGRELAPGDENANELFKHWQRARASQVLPGGDDVGGSEVLVHGRERNIRFRLQQLDTGSVLARPDAGIRYLLDSGMTTALGLGGVVDG